MVGLTGVCMFPAGSPNDLEAGFLNPFPDTGGSLLSPGCENNITVSTKEKKLQKLLECKTPNITATLCALW